MAFFEYPLSWPPEFPRTPAAERQADRFGSRGDRGWLKPLTTLRAFDRLLAEVKAFTRSGHSWRIDPEDLVVSTNLQVRRHDDRPRQDQREPGDVGVAVYFTLDGEDYCLPCDKWNTVAGNIAAVAAHLAAIRGIERWGVGDLRAAFRGFQSLPDPNRVVWRDVFGFAAGEVVSETELRARWKRLRAERHPDRGGSDDEFHRVNRAWALACEELGFDG
ncbi:MAG: J domain-containing protein [Gammaproteobacteria bacterium]